MRYNKILFVIPPTSEYKIDTPHMGVGYLSAFLESKGFEYEVIDMNLGHGIKDIHKKIISFDPDLLAITTYSTLGYTSVYDLIKELSTVRQDIVIGGAHVSTFRSKVLEECEADYAIKFEGEYILLELCRGKSLKEIRGLIYRKKEEIVENPDRSFIKDLDNLPFPKYHKFELERYGDRIPIMSSRGCPYKCIFCLHSKLNGREFRYRSPENVVEEIGYWYNLGHRKFTFHDDCFTYKKERVHKLCELLIESDLNDLSLEALNVRADCTDFELFKIMKEAGFDRVCIGVESGSEKILKIIEKDETIDDIEKSIKNACDVGLSVSLYFTVGHPYETLDDFEKSINLINKYPIQDVGISNLIPMPNTRLYQWLEKHNYFLIQLKEYSKYSRETLMETPLFETPELPREERRKMLRKAKNVERIWPIKRE